MNIPFESKSLYSAIEANSIVDAKKILDKSRFCASYDSPDSSPLLLAIELNNIDIVKLLVNHGYDLNNDDYGCVMFPLEKAIESNWSKDDINQLLELGADPNKMSYSNGSMHLAIDREDLDMIDLLVKAGAFIDGQNESGITPLMSASLNGIIEIVRKLLELGADPNITTQDDFPRTAVVCAAEYQHLEIVEYLLPLTRSEKQKSIAIKYLQQF
jgi:ankyrin repeat protein